MVFSSNLWHIILSTVSHSAYHQIIRKPPAPFPLDPPLGYILLSEATNTIYFWMGGGLHLPTAQLVPTAAYMQLVISGVFSPTDNHIPNDRCMCMFFLCAWLKIVCNRINFKTQNTDRDINSVLKLPVQLDWGLMEYNHDMLLMYGNILWWSLRTCMCIICLLNQYHI